MIAPRGGAPACAPRNSEGFVQLRPRRPATAPAAAPGHGATVQVTIVTVETVAHAREGDHDALNTLLRHVRPMLLRYATRAALSAGGSRDVAEDIVQETLVRMVRHLGRCAADSPGRFHAWALAIARRVVLDLHGAPLHETSPARLSLDTLDAVSPQQVLGEETSAGGADEGEAHRPTHDDVGHDVRAPHARLVHVTLRHLATLSETVVRILWWRALEQATWADIAGRVGSTPAAVKRRFQRAQHSIRRAVLAEAAWLSPSERRRLIQAAAHGGADVDAANDRLRQRRPATCGSTHGEEPPPGRAHERPPLRISR